MREWVPLRVIGAHLRVSSMDDAVVRISRGCQGIQGICKRQRMGTKRSVSCGPAPSGVVSGHQHGTTS